jgi:transposase
MLVGLSVGKRESRPWIGSDELCALIEPLLPEPGPKLVAGRPRVPDRQALCGILFVLHTGIQWEYLPQELGFGSGMTCWRRLAAWNEADVWDKLHLVLLAKLRAAKHLDWSRAGKRFLPCPGRSAGPKSGPSPVGRARPGSKHHLLVDGQGIPRAVSLTGRNRGRCHPAHAPAGEDPVCPGSRGATTSAA